MADNGWAKVVDYPLPDSRRYPEVLLIWPSPLGDVGLGYYNLLDGHWYWAEHGNTPEKTRCYPTHWRPLPAPPNEEG